MFLKIITILLPWKIKKYALKKLFGYKIHSDAYIGLSWIFPKKLSMEAGAKIDHFNVAIHLDEVEMKTKSTIGRGNWITGFPTQTDSLHFQYQTERNSKLILGESSSITKYHHLDCTSLIDIGSFATIAGYNSQFLTHSINVTENCQVSSPISIGSYTFIGTNVVILGGASLPSYSVLGAKSLLNKSFTKEWMLYGGVPAQSLKEIPTSAKYFSRNEGFVY